MTVIINLFGGPGTGKSTAAAGLFSLMKRQHMEVELISEYAKELVYEGKFDVLKKQDILLREQNRRQKRLIDSVDFAITDSPILMAVAYVHESFSTSTLDASKMKQKIVKTYNQYANFNFFLERVEKYSPIGRYQTESEARALDDQILALLDSHTVNYHSVKASGDCASHMFNILKANNGNT